jgi:CO dehydrogenase/acetyl-CoA synthase beta subunit
MDRIHIIGPKINEISASEISFSLFILLVVKDLSNKTHKDLRNLTFISDSIEGFTIRSIPRRFWCRISQIVINKGFSFRFLGETIISLYKKKYGQIINSVQVLMISSNPEMIRKWLDYTEEMREDLNARWRAKVDTWKKRIDCDFEWACKICPYFISCQKLQEVLESRKNLEI